MKKIYFVILAMMAMCLNGAMTSCSKDDPVDETEKKDTDPSSETDAIVTTSEPTDGNAGASYVRLQGSYNTKQIAVADLAKVKTGIAYSTSGNALKEAVATPTKEISGVTYDMNTVSIGSTSTFRIRVDNINPSTAVWYAAFIKVGTKVFMGEAKCIYTKTLDKAASTDSVIDGHSMAKMQCRILLDDQWISNNVSEFGIEYRATSGPVTSYINTTWDGKWTTLTTTVAEKNKDFNYSSNSPYYQGTVYSLIEGKKYEYRSYIKTKDGNTYRSTSKQFTLTVKTDGGKGDGGKNQTINVIVNGKTLPIPMIYVQGGSYQMGSNSCTEGEKPVHKVNLSSFYIAQYEFTQAMMSIITGESVTDYSKYRPYSCWTYNNAIEVCTTLNNALEAQGSHARFRLATEAEWEYAARGGQKSEDYIYSGSNILSEVAWTYKDQEKPKGFPFADPAIICFKVGQKKANELGIYDMSGNAAEYVLDRVGQAYYDSNEQTNPLKYGDTSMYYPIIRGFSAMYSGIEGSDVDSDWYYQNALRVVINSGVDYGIDGLTIRLVCCCWD